MGNEGCTETDAISFKERGETSEKNCQCENSRRLTWYWKKMLLQNKRQEMEMVCRMSVYFTCCVLLAV